MDFAHSRWGRTGLTLAALACSAVLFYFGTGLAPVPALTWLAPLPVLLLAPRVSGWAAAGVAFSACLLGTANSWDYQLHTYDEAMFPVGIMINLGMSLTFVIAVGVFRVLARRRRALLAAVATPAAWTGVLYLASLNPMGIMGTFANDQGDVPVVLQTASVTGMWGVEFLVMFAPSVVAALLTPGAATAARLRTATVAAVVFAVTLGAGAWRLSNENGAGTPQRVAAIAPNRYQWAPAVSTPAGHDLVAAYVREINALPDGVTTVVLPEGAFGSDQAEPVDLVQPMRQAAKARGIAIVLGLAHTAGKVKYNTALAFPGDGGDPASYLKHHDNVSPPGHDLVFVPAAGATTGVEICADLDFPNPSRDYATAGGRLLAVPSSDDDANGWKHSRTGLLRGVENGQPMTWADQNGTLMISDGFGRVLAEAHTGGPGQFTTITADVPTGPGATLYSRLGDWFAWFCLALTALALATTLIARPKKEARPKAGVAPQLIRTVAHND